MTMVLIDHSPVWVLADLDADPLEWARATILDRAAQEQVDLPGDQAQLLAEVLVPALESARHDEVRPLMVLFLLPEADEPAVCSVTVRADGFVDGVTLEELLEELRLPVEMLERPALEETVETAVGPATHLIQRYRAPVNAEYELVQEHEVYVWRVVVDEGVLGIYLSTSYLDLVEAGQWRPELAELAASLTLEADDAGQE
ncbi:hypothetical protein [Kineosporia sp. NBRC 101731]|uniref:hypothetical protein n=1 Tax=Kineosporia sp. NBRC 101731 TaxID=3032199 RepID=UPI0024A559B6|nr:hypothetical protein [Kineosporia sp. NBRC 101731]GLY30952.1 hypothetical protein Kisp02_43170 [Kineosporia sp. NBRC 101731]